MLSVACCLLLLSNYCMAEPDYPSWWITRGMVDTNATPNDYAGVNLGQLKWFATNAYDELEANLTGGADTNITSMVEGFSTSNNHVSVNLGQLKYVAQPYWNRLIEENQTNSYPWTTNTLDDADFAVANIGQLKHVFSFSIDADPDSDGDGLLDSVETGTGVFVSPTDTGSNPNLADSDGDGIDDGDEVSARTDPNNSDTNAPAITLSWPQNGSSQIWIP